MALDGCYRRIWDILLFFGIYQVLLSSAVDVWWSLGAEQFDAWRNWQLHRLGQVPVCNQLDVLSPRQIRFCQLYQDHMPSVSHGAQLGIHECQWQFRDHRWNCTSDGNETSAFGVIPHIASREAAFAHGIAAAGVVFAISQACREGYLTSCGCSRKKRPDSLHRDWIWGGCGDNTEYGYRFAQGFVDAREREKNHPRLSPGLARTLMNLHNNEAGRRALYSHPEVACKCHGVSGSCSLKTCWNQQASFRLIGERLRQRYDSSVQVRFTRRGTKLIRSNSRFRKVHKEDFVYLEESPNYCYQNPETGSLGTVGRRCDRNSDGIAGCNLMCCGRGYSTRKTKVSERCRCKFHWCCYVQCKVCERVVYIHTCK